MGLGKIELCMLSIIVASALYLHFCEEKRNVLVPLSGGDISTESLDFDPAAHQSIRAGCKSTGNGENAFVLDLAYSEFPDEDLGDTILQDLFNYCNCTNWGSDCYEWTLVIDELDFVKTMKGKCKTNDEYYPVYRNVTNPAGNSTVATVYVREGPSFDIQNFDCVYYTVNKVLENALLTTQKENAEVVTVLANEIEKVTSTN